MPAKKRTTKKRTRRGGTLAQSNFATLIKEGMKNPTSWKYEKPIGIVGNGLIKKLTRKRPKKGGNILDILGSLF